MKNLFLINEDEKSRILNLHETATKRQYLVEQPTLDLGQPTQPISTVSTLEDSGAIVKKGLGGDPYVYGKLGNDYYYAKASDGDSPNWVLATNQGAINSIKGKIYNEKLPVVKTVKSPVKNTAKKQPIKPITKKTKKPIIGKEKKVPTIVQKTVKTPQEEKSLFNRITSGVKQFVTNAVSFVVPIHYRIFYDFLSLRRKPFTVTDMSNDEQQALKQMIQYGFKHGFKNGGSMNFYDIANKLNDGSEQIDFKNKENLGLNQFRLKSEYTKLAMILGNATVTKKGNIYNVTDIYDFNNYKNNPEKYTLEEVPNTIKDSIKKVANGNLVQGIEQMSSYYQKLGYKGIPVDIELPA